MQPGDTQRHIVLKGTEDKVIEAKRRIDEIIMNQHNRNAGGTGGATASTARELDNPFLVKLPVPNEKVGIIIGRGGVTIKGIQERSRATIQIPSQPDANDPNVRTLTIGGDSKEICDAAQQEIFNSLNGSNNPVATSVAPGLTVVVPDDKVGLVIGKGGATCKDIQARLGVRLIIPQTPDAGSMPPSRTVSIIGPDANMPIAKYEIEMIIVGTPINQVGGMQQQQQQQQSQYGAYGGMVGAGGMGMQQPAYGMYGQAAYGANPYAGQPGTYVDPYAQTMNPYAQAMNPYMMQQQQASMYGMQQATEAQAQPTAAVAAPATEVPTDPKHYYNDFWQYAAYYGEAAARLYYDAWSPPQGTPPPPGIVVAPDAGTPAAAAAVATAPAAAQSSSAVTSGSGTQQVIDGNANPEAAAAAWEAYKKQYAEWYEAHGKAAGADPNPPAM